MVEALGGLGAAAPLARAHGRQQGGPIFVRCPYELSDYFGLIVSGIADELAAHGRPMVLDAGEASQARHPLGQLPVRAESSGAILVLPPEDTAELARLARHGFPFVIVDPRTAAPPGAFVVAAAHYEGARELTEHLLSLGHRRIAVLAGPTEWQVSRDRMAGHMDALARVGATQEPSLIESIPPTIDEGREGARRLLASPLRPTAIVCFNDKVAVGAMRAAAHAGLVVPGDVAVVGFDDSELSRATTPELTTVRQPLAEMGRVAVTQLLRVVDRQPMDARQIELAMTLVVRGSTGLAPLSPNAG